MMEDQVAREHVERVVEEAVSSHERVVMWGVIAVLLCTLLNVWPVVLVIVGLAGLCTSFWHSEKVVKDAVDKLI